MDATPNPFRTVIFATLLVFSMTAAAASFDCTKAASGVEKKVCVNPDLSQLDDALGGAYREALTAVAQTSKPTLIKEQRDWIRYVRNVCDNDTCLTEAYRSRIALLQKNEKYLANRASCDLPEGKTCRSVVWYRNPAARINAFNASLAEHQFNGKIIGCSKLLDLPVGTAHGNHSFGGLCTLEQNTKRKAITICNDAMVGHFAVNVVGSNIPTDQDLIDFTNKQCFGG